jgi:TP901 family phage tail tape measure protein
MATRDEVLRFLIEAKGDDELRALALELDKLAKSGDAAEGDISAFVEELDKLARVDRSIGALVKLKSALAETGTNLDRARQRVDELEKEFAQAEQPTAKLRRELEAARNAVDRLSKEQGRQTAELNRNANALRAAGVDTERLGSAQRQVRQDITSLSDRFGRYTTQLREAGTGAERAAKGTRDLGSAAKAANTDLAGVELGLGKIAAAAGAAVAALQGIQFGTGLLADATALQGQLAEVQAIAGAGAEEFALLREAAEGAAADTGIAIEQVTAGLGELARAGFETKDTIAALRPALDLAQAGSLSLSESVEITTTTLTQFGEGADQAGRVADVLASAANSTQSSVEGLGRALTDVAPLARQLDISFEETVAILGRLADEGFRGSRAGTALRSAFAQLLDPSSQFREELSKLGITSTDFTTVLEQLATKGDAGRTALLALGQEAAPAILALAGKGGEAIRALTADLQGAEGSANRVAQAIRDTLGNAFSRLQETAGNAIRQLIDPLLKPLQSLLESVTARLAAFANSEDFAKIRDGLALAFENGVATVREFFDTVDFTQLTTDVQTFAVEAGKSFGEIRTNVEALVNGFNAVSSAVRVFGNAIQIGVAAAESNLLSIERRLLSVQRGVLNLSNAFGFVDEELAGIDRRIGEIDRRQTQLRQNGERDWGQLKQAASEFGTAVSGADEDLKGLTNNTGPINALVGGIKNLAVQFGLIPPEVKKAAEEIKLLPEVVANGAGAIQQSNQQSAASFQLPANASRAAVEAILEQWRGTRAALEQQIGAIQRSLSGAFDDPQLTEELQRKLREAQAELAAAEQGISSAEQALLKLGAAGDEAARGLGNVGSAAGGANAALRSVEQQSDDSFSNIGNKVSQVTGGPLAALGAEFERIRKQAVALGDEATRAFDSTLRVGETVRGTGFTIEQFYQRQIDRLALAERTTQELATAYNNSASQAERLASASAEVAQNAALSLEAQRAANLEYAQQLLQIEQERAKAQEQAARSQQAAAASLGEQVRLTQELARVRETMPPEVIEVRARNEQKPGEILAEIGEPQLDAFAQRVVSRIAINGRVVLG